MSAVIQGKLKLPSLINLLLVIALGILASKLMWLVITPKGELSYQVEQVSSVTSSTKKAVNYGKLISNQHLFGIVKKKKVVKATPKKVITKPVVAAPKLNLKLHGIVAYKKNEGLALISSNNGPQKVFGEGEEIQKNVTVQKVLSNKVVLNNHGKSEDLLLPVKNKANASNKRIVKPTPPTRRNTTKKKIARQAAAETEVNLGTIRQEAMKNPAKIMDIARPSPAIVKGKFIGFRIQPGTKRKLFRKLGFRPNDIIIEVNGIILDDANKGPMVLAELAQASSLVITVQRGSQNVYIEHSF